MQERLPLTADAAVSRRLLDASFGESAQDFGERVLERSLALAAAHNLARRLAQKQTQRDQDEAHKPLADYRAEELQRMHRNFYGFDPSYHVARHHFVYRKPHAWTPRHLAVHR